MTANSVKSLINDEYRKLREQRELYDEEYKNSLYKYLPQVEEIDKEIALLAVRWAYKVVTDGITPDEAVASVESKREMLKAQREEIIKKSGFAPYKPLPYKCNICKDTGNIGDDKCICYKQYLRKYMMESSSLVSNFSCNIENDTFENFRFDFYDRDEIHPVIKVSSYDNIKNAYNYCKKYCLNFNETSPNLFITGSSGLGKTYLTNCITNELLGNGYSVVYQSAASMFRFLEDYKFDKIEREANENHYKSIYDCDLLIIDDLGTEFPTTYTNSVFFDLLNTRILNNKKLIISTNTNIKDIEKRYTERVSSRIIGEFVMISLFGKDIRRKKLEMKNGGRS